MSFSPTLLGLGLDDRYQKIVGGEVTHPQEFPHHVAIYRNGSETIHCGGSLLSSLIVVTAAHCLLGIKSSRFKIVAGEHDRLNSSGLEQTRYVREVYLNQKFDGFMPLSDIALMLVNEPFNFTSAVQSVILPEPMEEFSGVATLVGFGKQREDETEGIGSQYLRKVDVPIVSFEECKKNYSGAGLKLDNGTVCSGTPGKDSCQGDSGGGMLCRRQNSSDLVLCGIVSAGLGCAREGYPGINTKVAFFVSWIRDAERRIVTQGKCQTNEFYCSGKCLPRTAVCNSVSNCPNGDDELHCGSNSTQAECDKNEFRCNNGKCITAKYLCDGDSDCSDGSDEFKCSLQHAFCSKSDHICGNSGRCIPGSWKCDGLVDCNDYSDEYGCPGSNLTTPFPEPSTVAPTKPPGDCKGDQFYCPGFLFDCGPKAWICDGEEDCEGGIDESDCDSVQSNGTIIEAVNNTSWLL